MVCHSGTTPFARNKKSVTLNLKSDKGRELAFDLLTKTDVVIENFRPGAMESWGLGPEQVKAQNPGVIYARISGYGQSGPFSSPAMPPLPRATGLSLH